MSPDTPVFLTRVNYAPEKRQITVEFSNTEEKFSKRFPFFPKTHYALGAISREAFLELLAREDLKKIKTSFLGGNATVFAATFNDLKSLNNLVLRFLGFESNLIEPERQFLIEQGWNYFDAFVFRSGEPELVPGNVFPDVSMSFFSDSLRQTVSDLMVSNKRLAHDLVQRVVHSRLLKIPLLESEHEMVLGDIFLENIFFESASPINFSVKPVVRSEPVFFGKSKIDFSKLVSVLASQPFNNLGVESVNCECCKPVSVESTNVLPSTLVNVRFLREGFYFNPVSRLWGEGYHRSRPGKDSREARKKEYSYSFYPAGPFSRNQMEGVLLADALRLEQNGFAETLDVSSFEWFCLVHESAFSKQVNSLKASIGVLNKAIEKQTVSSVASAGLFYSQFLESSPDFFYRKSLEKTISGLLGSLYFALSTPGNRFFSEKNAVCLETISGSVARDFEEVVASTLNERVSFSSSSAFIDSSALLEVSKRFSELYKVDRQLLGLRVR